MLTHYFLLKHIKTQKASVELTEYGFQGTCQMNDVLVFAKQADLTLTLEEQTGTGW
jgi:hypothetical protein